MKTALIQLRRHCGRFMLLLAALGFIAGLTTQAGSPPVVSNVTASQRSGTKLVDIHYDLADSDSTNLSISILVSADGGTNYNVQAYSITGDYGGGISPGTGKAIVWNAGNDWDGQFTTNCRVRVIANDADPDGFVLIPAGSFSMGDPLDGESDALPVHTVTISAFYMEKSLVTGAHWNAVYQYAVTHGYAFDHVGTNKALSHPVQTISWYDTVKWCNARSQLEGRTPAYYTDAGLTVVYRIGQVTNPFVNWSANGYRLPTEAEWEKAARGGLSGKRFPWGDTITTNQANYYGDTNAPYNLSGGFGYHPAFATGAQPYTSPVASFPASGYGLFDMAGNIFEWCWDWYGSAYYSSSPATDPLGPGSGTDRVLRGGSWSYYTYFSRCATRFADTPTNAGSFGYGFRCVKGP